MRESDEDESGPRSAAGVPAIDPERCSGCGRCLAACRAQAIAFVHRDWRKRARLTKVERCTGCGRCVASCLHDAFAPRFAMEHAADCQAGALSIEVGHEGST
ncbi:MAG: 4Fe-4S dicluster domain-containing protein [Deltaproteobacteria bacterium]|nr:4Fe-4S dicluster domain-containing protein [Deltaproteobacteria bacterium]